MLLKEAIKIKNGKSRPKEKEEGIYPIYGANGIIYYSNEYNAPPKSVIVGRVGSYCGSVYYSKTKCWVTDNAIMVNSKENYDPKYLFYLFQTLQLNKRSTGSGQPLLNQAIIKSINTNIPSLPEQKRIANILSSFDDKIELLREQNKTLENIAQTIFKQWFIDFNFPDNNGKPYKGSGGKMKDSELGMIPEEWEADKLESFIRLQSGFSHNTKLKGMPKSKIAKMGVVDGQGFFNRDFVIDYPGLVDKKYKLTQDDLLICTRDMTRDKIVIGNVARVPKDLSEYDLYAGSNTWIIKTGFNKNYLYLLFRSKPFREHIIRSSKGSTIVMITQNSFLNYDLCIPDKKILQRFNSIVDPLLQKIQINITQELKNLKLKKELLDKLFN